MVKSKENTTANPLFSHQVLVLPEHMDGLQHSNNACYVRWCEEAAWAHSRALGLTLSDYQSLDRAMAVRRAEYDYRAPSFAGDTLLITTWLHDMCTTGMQRGFSVTRQGDEQLVLTANWQLSCIAISSGKLKRLPAEFRGVYGAVLLKKE